jgi:hypothetical protein
MVFVQMIRHAQKGFSKKELHVLLAQLIVLIAFPKAPVIHALTDSNWNQLLMEELKQVTVCNDAETVKGLSLTAMTETTEMGTDARLIVR